MCSLIPVLRIGASPLPAQRAVRPRTGRKLDGVFAEFGLEKEEPQTELEFLSKYVEESLACSG